MIRIHPVLLTLTPFLFASAATAADVTVFEGPAGGVGGVVHIASGGGSSLPAALQGIRLLPFDVTGRSLVHSLLPDHPRLRVDVAGANRILLPNGNGSLYRYRRDGAGGSAFGYFVVRLDGSVAPLFEVPGAGPAGTDDPLPRQISVSPDGSAFLVATTRAGGGDLYEIEVASGATIAHTAKLPALHFPDGGLCLLDDWGVALTRHDALRFQRGIPGSAELVPPPAPISATALVAEEIGFMGRGMASSADFSTVAFVAGPTSQAAFVYVVRRKGPAEQVSEVGRPLAGAGFLPGVIDGPTLALAPDGSRVAWRSEGVTREAWSRSTTPQGAPPSFQITADERFTDTLGETGVIAFVNPNELTLLVGEENAPVIGGIESGDLFSFDTVTNTVTNLSLTSGQATAPFLAKGRIDTLEGIWAVPGSSSIVMVERTDTGTREALLVDTATGARDVLLDRIKSIDFATVAGGEMLLAVERDDPGRELELRRYAIGGPATATLFGRLRSGSTFLGLEGGLGGDLAVHFLSGGSQWFARGLVPQATGSLLLGVPATYGPAIDVQADGTVLGSVHVGGLDFAFAWPASGTPLPMLGAPSLQVLAAD